MSTSALMDTYDLTTDVVVPSEWTGARRKESGRVLTSISFSVQAKHCLSGSDVGFSEQNRHSPPKPISSRISFSTGPAPFITAPEPIMAVAKLGFAVSVCSSPCAASSVAEFWLWRRTSSRMVRIGLQLLWFESLASGNLVVSAPVAVQ